MKRSIAFVLFAGLLLVGAAQPARAATHEWLVVSDVHFDPFADPRLTERLASSPAARWRSIFASNGPQAFSGYGSDTNFALLESSLDAMRNAASDPPVVMITGDFLAHSFRDRFDRTVRNHDDAHFAAFVDETMRFLASEFRAAFPRARMLPVIGNNDGYCGDYQSTPSSPFLATMASIWGASVGAENPNAFAAQFATGGYYTVPLPAGGAQAVVLNDVFWSAQYRNTCGQKTADPGGDEVAWLTRTMQAVGSKNVWVLAHIPPGIDAYSSLQANPQVPVPFLLPRFNEAMINALSANPPHVVMAIAAHTHMNTFRVLGPDPSRPYTPMLVVPSISPVYANNPSFTLLRVRDEDAGVEDARYFVLDDLAALSRNGRAAAHWRREYVFDSIYGHGSVDADHLSHVQDEILDDDRVRHRFEQYYDGESGRASMTDTTWRDYWCANVALTMTVYQACAIPQIQHQLPPHPPAPPTAVPTASPSPSPSPSSTP